MLPHVQGRPVTLHKFPAGIGGQGFYQKEVGDSVPDWVRTVEVEKEGGTVTHLVVEEAATLVYLAQQNCITPHIWLSRAEAPRRPDRLVFDLDPSRDDFAAVRTAARRLRDELEDLGLVPFVMTSGSRGLHVVVPLAGKDDVDAVRALAREVAERLVARHPDQLTVEHRKDQRRGRIFVDVLRNGYAQTAVAPYAVRAREEAPVATPLDWSELGDGRLHPRRYRIANLFRRLGRKADPWRGIDRRARGLDRARAALARQAG